MDIKQEKAEAHDKSARLKTVLQALAEMPTKIERISALAYACTQLGLVVPAQSWLQGKDLDKELGLSGEKGEKSRDKATVPVSDIFALCEDLENEAYEGLETLKKGLETLKNADPSINLDYSEGYWKGYARSAKTIRKAIGAIT